MTKGRGPKARVQAPAVTSADLLSKRGLASLLQLATTAADRRVGEIRRVLQSSLRGPVQVVRADPTVTPRKTVEVRLSIAGEARLPYVSLKATDALYFGLKETIAAVLPEPAAPGARAAAPETVLVAYTYEFWGAKGAKAAEPEPTRLFRFEWVRGQRTPGGYEPRHHLHVTGLDDAGVVERLHFPVWPFLERPDDDPSEVLPRVLDWNRRDVRG